jgi:subtilisin family serine protease
MHRIFPLVLLATALALPTAALGLDALAPTAPPPAADPDVLRDQVILGFHGSIPADIEAWLAARGGSVVLRDDALRFVAVHFVSTEAAERALALAQGRADVRYAQFDGIARTQLEPNDPRYGEQWGYPVILAPQAWDVTLGTSAVKVAILDTGVKGNHVDLAPNICGPHASFVPGEVALQDGFGHGTHVAGTVAAVTNNGIGVAGTSQSCLMDVKVLSRWGGGQWSWIAAGIRFAADNGAHIQSMSLGGGNPGTIMEDAVKYALAKNSLIIAAAGNSGCPDTPANARTYMTTDGTIIWPARYDDVLAVAALAPPDGLGAASFSSCGADMEIAAPGQGVLSTAPPCGEAWAICSSSGYAGASGTSMATPHVSGVAALVKGMVPTIGATGLRCVVDLSADDMLDTEAALPLPGRDYTTGWGKANALRAISQAKSLADAGALDAFAQACTTGAKAILH